MWAVVKGEWELLFNILYALLKGRICVSMIIEFNVLVGLSPSVLWFGKKKKQITFLFGHFLLSKSINNSSKKKTIGKLISFLSG